VGIEEQDQVFGRLSRQSGESWRKVSAFGAKAGEFRIALLDAAQNLNDRDLLGPEGLGPQGTIAAAIRAAHEIPDRQAVLVTLGNCGPNLNGYAISAPSLTASKLQPREAGRGNPLKNFAFNGLWCMIVPEVMMHELA